MQAEANSDEHKMRKTLIEEKLKQTLKWQRYKQTLKLPETSSDSTVDHLMLRRLTHSSGTTHESIGNIKVKLTRIINSYSLFKAVTVKI